MPLRSEVPCLQVPGPPAWGFVHDRTARGLPWELHPVVHTHPREHFGDAMTTAPHCRRVSHFGPRDGRFSPILAIFGVPRRPILVKLGTPTRRILVDTGAQKRSILVKLEAVGGPILVHFGPPPLDRSRGMQRILGSSFTATGIMWGVAKVHPRGMARGVRKDTQPWGMGPVVGKSESVLTSTKIVSKHYQPTC